MSESVQETVLARSLGVGTFAVNLVTVGVIADVFRSLDATPSELSAFDISRPTLAVSLFLVAAAGLAFGIASVAASWRGSARQAAAFLFASCVLLVATWAMHQALWHLVRGMSHTGPYWFGRS